MIRSMKHCQTILIALILTAPVNAQSLLAPQSTPTLRVFVYSFPGFSPWGLGVAENEAMRLLRPAQIELKWIDCNSRVLPASCRSPHALTDLIVRFLPKALPEASATALGIATSSAGYATAFIFYNRILALRSYQRPLPFMLARVLAHEVTHLLLPYEDHDGFGLMRGEWSADDLYMRSTACLGLSARSAQLMHGEALRRMLIAQRRSLDLR